MAAVSNNKSSEATISVKVQCWNQEKVNQNLKAIELSTTALVDSTTVFSEEEKNTIKGLFTKHRYDSNFTLFNGVQAKGDDGEDYTPEFEPLNVERQQYKDLLVASLDSSIVQTTKKRKHYPHQCVQQLAKKLQSEHNFMVKVKAVPEKQTSKDKINISDEHLIKQEQAIKETAEKCYKLMQHISNQVVDAENLSHTLILQSMMGSTPTDDVLFNIPSENKTYAKDDLYQSDKDVSFSATKNLLKTKQKDRKQRTIFGTHSDISPGSEDHL